MNTGLFDGLPLLQRVALGSTPRARQALWCAEITMWCKAAIHSVSLHSLLSLDRMLPGSENILCTQLLADNAAMHQAYGWVCQGGQRESTESRKELGAGGRERGNERKKKEGEEEEEEKD